MNCYSLRELSKLIDMNNILVLAVLYTYIREKCIGRVSLSKKLKIGERTARRIINFLKNINILSGFENVCICSDLINNLQLDIGSAELGKYRVSLVNIDDDELLKYINNHVVRFRDYIVIKTKNPQSIEVIGYFNGLEYVIPGLPIDLLKKYRELLSRISMIKNTLFILWREYTEYYCEAVVASSLYNICTDMESNIT